MIDKRKIYDILSVLVSSGVLLLSGILTNLIVPKIMGVVNYGYYKIFILYGTYIALTHMGIVDGILLKYGGKSLNKYDLILIRSYLRVLFYFSVAIAIVLIIIALYIFKGYIRWIILFLGMQVIISNLFYYLQYLTQALMRFKTFSFFNILQALLNISSTTVIYILKKIGYLSILSYKIYIPIYLLIYSIILLGYLINLKDLVFGKVKSFFQVNNDIWNLIKIGFPVTVSYQIATLVFNIDNQFISMFFSTVIFGLYSFAYSMVSIVTTILNTLSTVIFPNLNRLNLDNAIKNYSKLIMLLLMLVYLMVMVYYPVEIIVKLFLPEYLESLIYFKIVIPGVGISSCISLIIFNYFKTLKKGHIYFIYGCSILVLAIILNSLIYFATHSAIAIAGMSLVILFSWYLITNSYLVRNYHVAYKKNTFYMLSMMLVFEIDVLNIKNMFYSIIIYLISYALITFLVYKNDFYKLKRKFIFNK